MIICLDIGTTNVKAFAFSDAGEVWAVAERRNQTISPQLDRSEQDPEAILQHLREVLDEALSEAKQQEPIRGLVFSSAMHGLLAVDTAGRPLTNIWLWSDLRAAQLATTLRYNNIGLDIYERTGVPIHPMSPLLKIIWLRQNEPEIFAKTHKFLGIKEYLLFQLLGKYLSDLPVASATGLMNIERNRWDDHILKLLDITAAQLPELVLPTHIETLPEKAAAALNLPKGLPIIIGGSDGALANLGAGATTPGQWAVTIGTSAAIRMVTSKPLIDQKMRTFCYRLDDVRCIVGGGSNNGTNALEWLRVQVVGSQHEAGDFAQLAADVPAGAEELLFLPYLLGERAPLWNAHARGSFHGLTAQHSQAHFVRAVMEGVLFNLKLIAESLEAVQPLEIIHAGGGFSNSRLWVQMLADIFQKPVSVDERGVDASILGALRVACQALGLPDLVDRQHVTIVQPDKTQAAIYAGAYERFEQLAGIH